MHSTFTVDSGCDLLIFIVIYCDLISFLFSLGLRFGFQRCSSGTQAVARPSRSLVGQRTMRIAGWFRALSGWCSRRRCMMPWYNDAMMQWCISGPFFGKEAIRVKKARTVGWSQVDRPFERDQPNTACTSRTWRYTRTLRFLFPIASSVSACVCFRSSTQLNSSSRWAFQNSNYQYQQPLHVCFLGQKGKPHFLLPFPKAAVWHSPPIAG